MHLNIQVVSPCMWLREQLKVCFSFCLCAFHRPFWWLCHRRKTPVLWGLASVFGEHPCSLREWTHSRILRGISHICRYTRHTERKNLSEAFPLISQGRWRPRRLRAHWSGRVLLWLPGRQFIGLQFWRLVLSSIIPDHDAALHAL